MKILRWRILNKLIKVLIVNKDNLSLAIGKKGQNVKLASRLTHFKIEVKSYDDVNVEDALIDFLLEDENIIEYKTVKL